MTRPRRQALSRARQELRQTWERMGPLLEIVQGRYALVRGTLYERKRRCGRPGGRCGRPGCRCARGELHVSQAFGVSEDGKTRHRPLTHVDHDRLRAGVDAYGRFRAARRQLRAASRHLLALVDELEQARCVPWETCQDLTTR